MRKELTVKAAGKGIRGYFDGKFISIKDAVSKINDYCRYGADYELSADVEFATRLHFPQAKELAKIEWFKQEFGDKIPMIPIDGKHGIEFVPNEEKIAENEADYEIFRIIYDVTHKRLPEDNKKAALKNLVELAKKYPHLYTKTLAKEEILWFHHSFIRPVGFDTLILELENLVPKNAEFDDGSNDEPDEDFLAMLDTSIDEDTELDELIDEPIDNTQLEVEGYVYCLNYADTDKFYDEITKCFPYAQWFDKDEIPDEDKRNTYNFLITFKGVLTKNAFEEFTKLFKDIPNERYGISYEVVEDDDTPTDDTNPENDTPNEANDVEGSENSVESSESKTTYTCYFYIYDAAKEDEGKDPYVESYKLTFDNLKDAVLAAFEDCEKTGDYKDYGGAVVVANEINKAMFEILRNGDIEGGYLEVYAEVKEIVDEYLSKENIVKSEYSVSRMSRLGDCSTFRYENLNEAMAAYESAVNDENFVRVKLQENGTVIKEWSNDEPENNNDNTPNGYSPSEYQDEGNQAEVNLKTANVKSEAQELVAQAKVENKKPDKKLYRILKNSEEWYDNKVVIFPEVEGRVRIEMMTFCAKLETAYNQFARGFNQAVADGVMPQALIDWHDKFNLAVHFDEWDKSNDWAIEDDLMWGSDYGFSLHFDSMENRHYIWMTIYSKIGAAEDNAVDVNECAVTPEALEVAVQPEFDNAEISETNVSDTLPVEVVPVTETNNENCEVATTNTNTIKKAKVNDALDRTTISAGYQRKARKALTISGFT